MIDAGLPEAIFSIIGIVGGVWYVGNKATEHLPVWAALLVHLGITGLCIWGIVT